MRATTRRALDFLDGLARPAGRPLVLGVSGPQGGGKSTLASELTEAFELRGERAVAVSIDDVYLTRAEQVALAAQHPTRPFLHARGYPGTHDVDLGTRTLDALRALGPGEQLHVPRYDKGAFEGRGDRAPAHTWPVVTGSLGLVVFEGWCLGFTPVREAALADPLLDVPNRALSAHAAWHERLDALVHLDAEDPNFVVAWRIQSEAARRARGEGALSDADAEAYVRSFLPAYAAWVPGLRAASPIVGPLLRIEIDSDREPIER